MVLGMSSLFPSRQHVIDGLFIVLFYCYSLKVHLVWQASEL